MSILQIKGVYVRLVGKYDRVNDPSIISFVQGRVKVVRLADREPGPALFVGILPESSLLKIIQALETENVSTSVLDNQGAGVGSISKQTDVRASIGELRKLLGRRATFLTRRECPSLSRLVSLRQYEGAVCVVADGRPGVFLTVLKLLGVVYPLINGGAAALDADAAIFDAGDGFEKLSHWGQLLYLGTLGLPQITADSSALGRLQQTYLYAEFVLAVQGDPQAHQALQVRATRHDEAITESKRVAAIVQEIAPGFFFVDAATGKKFNAAILEARLAACPGVKVTIIRQGFGDIAVLTGNVQYSLRVMPAAQREIDLQVLLPPGFVSSAANGIICDSPSALDVSQQVWLDTIWSALHTRFPAVR